MYLLRWRFDYLGNRPTKYGQWSRGAAKGPDGKVIMSDMAAFQNKEGLLRASIEGKDVATYQIKNLAECDGHDFVNFQWMAEFRGRVGGGGVHHHVGLKLVTRDFWIEIYAKGTYKKIPRTAEDKLFHYETFGR